MLCLEQQDDVSSRGSMSDSYAGLVGCGYAQVQMKPKVPTFVDCGAIIVRVVIHQHRWRRLKCKSLVRKAEGRASPTTERTQPPVLCTSRELTMVGECLQVLQVWVLGCRSCETAVCTVSTLSVMWMVQVGTGASC